MDIIKNKINVNVLLPKKDLSNWDNNYSEISVTTEFNTQTNSFLFKLRIPTYIFNGVADSDIKYITKHEKPEHSWQTKAKTFTQYLSSPVLSILIEDLNNICVDSMRVKEREIADTEKYIAINFNQSNLQAKDVFNFASMGKITKSSFQFFVVHKIIKAPNSLDRYNYKSRLNVENKSGLNNNKPDGWYYFGVGVVEKYQLIKWTQEREDYLQSVQDTLNDVNQKLEKFLGNIDENKIIELMENNPLMLNK
jgi:hypothetical protein